MTSSHAYGKMKRKYFYYRCTKGIHSVRSECDGPSAPAKALDEATVDRLRTLSLDPGLLATVVEGANTQGCQALQELERERNRWEGKRLDADKELQNLVNAIKEAGGSRVLLEALREQETLRDEIAEQLDDIRSEIARLKTENVSADSLANTLREFQQFVEEGSLEILKKVVPLFVETAVWYEDRLHLSLYQQPFARDHRARNGTVASEFQERSECRIEGE